MKKSNKKRKNSKIIVPTDGAKRSAQAFRCDDELSRLLDQQENKSEFIVKAVWEALGKQCPTCNGTGIVKREKAA